MSAGFPAATISGLPVVSGPAEIDIANAGQLRAALLAAAAQGHATIVVDLTETSFCDTSGLQVLVLAHRRAAAEGGELRLVVRSATLQRLFSLTVAVALGVVFGAVVVPDDLPASSTPPTDSPATTMTAVIATFTLVARRSR